MEYLFLFLWVCKLHNFDVRLLGAIETKSLEEMGYLKVKRPKKEVSIKKRTAKQAGIFERARSLKWDFVPVKTDEIFSKFAYSKTKITENISTKPEEKSFEKIPTFSELKKQKSLKQESNLIFDSKTSASTWMEPSIIQSETSGSLRHPFMMHSGFFCIEVFIEGKNYIVDLYNRLVYDHNQLVKEFAEMNDTLFILACGVQGSFIYLQDVTLKYVENFSETLKLKNSLYISSRISQFITDHG